MSLELLASMPPEERDPIMETIPALDPPSGVFDFENPGGSHVLGYGVIIFCSTLAVLSVLLRLYTRAVLKLARIEDFFFIAALGLYAGHQYVSYDLAIYPGIGVHQWNIPLSKLTHILYHIHLGSLFYGLVIMCLKTAILLDWLHIFVPKGTRNYIWWISQVLIWSNILFYGVGTIVEIFQCSPREKIWNILILDGSCPMNMPVHNIASGVINLISDIVILALPQRVIWKLQMSLNKKLGVSLLFAIGLFACICAVIRLIFVDRMLKSDDKIYTVSTLALWGIGEMTSGFLIIGIPALPKAAKALPISESFTSLLRTLTRTNRSESSKMANEPGSWNRAISRKNNGPWESIEADEHALVSIKAMDHKAEHPPTGISREVQVTISNRQRSNGSNV